LAVRKRKEILATDTHRRTRTGKQLLAVSGQGKKKGKKREKRGKRIKREKRGGRRGKRFSPPGQEERRGGERV
jgi:hypothetical protein